MIAQLSYLAPFSFGDRVAIPSMAHLGTGRVLSCRFTDHPVIGSCWMVTLKLAGSGDVLERPASNVKGA